MPAPHHLVFLQAGCPSCRPTNSVKALKAKKSEKNVQFMGNASECFCASVAQMMKEISLNSVRM